jgi:hypothetical protein
MHGNTVEGNVRGEETPAISINVGAMSIVEKCEVRLAVPVFFASVKAGPQTTSGERMPPS